MSNEAARSKGKQVTTPDDFMRPFSRLIGRWKTSGSVFDEHGRKTISIAGTDEYEWMTGGHWIIHRVDVMMGDDHVRALELIGDHDAEGDSYTFRAFDSSGSFDTMIATQRPDGAWKIQGDGVRTTLSPGEDGSFMTAHWEREVDNKSGTWIRWIDMRFDLVD